MKLNIANRLPKSANNACQLIFLFSDGKLKGQVRKIDADNEGLVKNLYKSGDFTAKDGQTLLLHGLKGSAANRVLLTGLGDRAKADANTWRKASSSAAQAVSTTPSTSVLSDCLTSVTVNNMDAAQMAEHLAREITNANYRFTLHSSKSQQPELEALVLSCERSLTDSIERAASHGVATANGMALARDLGNLAPNFCTPEYLADQAVSLATEFENFTTEIIDEAGMKALGMGALLSVSAGSEQPARLIVMNYQGKTRAGSPIVLVGKGITFDTGGISIKPSDGMDEMKFDMCGAASVFGAMRALGELQADLNVVGVVAAAENMPDGRATRPGDVITSMSGKTIEILNTDAEGRLVLCDALTYSQRFKPSAIVDIATLTGAAVMALGHHMSAVFGNHRGTVDALCAAGDATGDLTWPMPMNSDYQSQLDSNFADMANIGGRPAGAVTAACFLARFAEDMNWAHLDIAGVAWNSGKNKGATGRPVPLLMKFLEQHIKS
ncbi:MAG: leucyl aminopeptidase [Granulosicoccus sp.]